MNECEYFERLSTISDDSEMLRTFAVAPTPGGHDIAKAT